MPLTGLDMIREYRTNPEKYLPMYDVTWQMSPRNEYDEVSIGWNAGLLDGNRPYFADCWAIDQVTMLTFYLCTKDIEGASPEFLAQLFIDSGYFWPKEGYKPPYVRTFTDKNGNEFYSINLGVGVDDSPASIGGAPIIAYSRLNEFNRNWFADETE